MCNAVALGNADLANIGVEREGQFFGVARRRGGQFQRLGFRQPSNLCHEPAGRFMRLQREGDIKLIEINAGAEVDRVAGTVDAFDAQCRFLNVAKVVKAAIDFRTDILRQQSAFDGKLVDAEFFDHDGDRRARPREINLRTLARRIAAADRGAQHVDFLC